MRCPREPTFRLLDARVGWEACPVPELVGFDDEAGVVLAPKNPHEVSPQAVLPFFYPPWLAASPGSREWFLAPPSPACRLLRWQPCDTAFRPWGPAFEGVDAVAVSCHAIAVAQRDAGRVTLLDAVGRQRAHLTVSHPGALAFTPWGELFVASRHRVWRFGPAGDARGHLPGRFHEVVAIRVDSSDRIWIVHRDESGALLLTRLKPPGVRLKRADPTLLPKRMSPTGIRAWSARGFCWSDPGGPVAPCLDRHGAPIAEGSIEPFGLQDRVKEGTLLTLPIDSGEARTVWHRVRVDADVPFGTDLRIAVATIDSPAERIADEDWDEAPPGARDFLCSTPPGRYLRLRLKVRGEGGLTPTIRQVRIDYPRVTSASLLPEVYLEEPRAADFTERFLSLFDAELERLDGAIRGFPALLSVDAAPAEVLSWLGSFLGVAFPSSWDEQRRRAFLREAPALYRARGTPYSLVRTLEIACGVAPALTEPGNPFGAVSRTATLGSTRLFGRNKRRFRIGHSPLGGAKLRSLGNPDADPFLELAHRFIIQFPPGVARSSEERDRLAALVQALKPAHTVATIRFGGSALVVGSASAVGVDTALVPPPAPILGRNTWLSRATVLWPSAGARDPGLTLGWTVTGISTSL